MSKYEVKDVVCDYGVYEDGELKLILNSKRNAIKIVEILEKDDINFREEIDFFMFSDRVKLEKLYEKWISESTTKDCPLNVISFLQANGLLHIERARKFLKNRSK